MFRQPWTYRDYLWWMRKVTIPQMRSDIKNYFSYLGRKWRKEDILWIVTRYNLVGGEIVYYQDVSPKCMSRWEILDVRILPMEICFDIKCTYCAFGFLGGDSDILSLKNNRIPSRWYPQNYGKYPSSFAICRFGWVEITIPVQKET